MKLIQDKQYPTMWRVKYEDGTFSDILNKVRAKELKRVLEEEIEKQRARMTVHAFCIRPGRVVADHL